MTAKVVTAAPETLVQDLARLMREHRISALPVVRPDGGLVGIVTEGDLIRRVEIGTDRPDWWLDLVQRPGARAATFVRTHGRHASDVMTREVETVSEDTPIGDIALTFERSQIKRVPVLRDGRVVGIVSRADLVRALAAGPAQAAATPSDQDRGIRDRVLAAIDRETWIAVWNVSVLVSDGIAYLWGFAESDPERRALRVLVEDVPGVRSVVDHIGLSPRPAAGIE